MTNKCTNDPCDQKVQIASNGMPELSPGVLLQEERKRQKLKIKDVASYLKIPEQYVIALEADQYNNLPGKTFALGYLRNYAQMLHLDITTFEKHLQNLFLNDEKSFTISGMPSRHKKLSPVMWFSMIFTAILLVIVVLAGIWVYHHFSLDPDGISFTKTATKITPEKNI
ncbi:MAG: helix-turn-helix domain-containing protein [Endozoicomonadaceae bacterium]|nr:helix-turn-helix domain-containing protein [Endozoicomonadaceae bacterium]